MCQAQGTSVNSLSKNLGTESLTSSLVDDISHLLPRLAASCDSTRRRVEACAWPPSPPRRLPGWSRSASRTGMSHVHEHDHRPSAGVTEPGVVVGPQHRRGGTKWALFREGAVWPWGKLHHEAMQMRGKGSLRSGEPHHSTEWGPTCRSAEGEAHAEMQREGSTTQGAHAGSTALPQRKAGQRGGRGSQALG